jgi:hypothetical protein
MRGPVLYGPRDVRFEERDVPRIIKPTDAVIRISDGMEKLALATREREVRRELFATPSISTCCSETCGSVQSILLAGCGASRR